MIDDDHHDCQYYGMQRTHFICCRTVSTIWISCFSALFNWFEWGPVCARTRYAGWTTKCLFTFLLELIVRVWSPLNIADNIVISWTSGASRMLHQSDSVATIIFFLFICRCRLTFFGRLNGCKTAKSVCNRKAWHAQDLLWYSGRKANISLHGIWVNQHQEICDRVESCIN